METCTYVIVFNPCVACIHPACIVAARLLDAIDPTVDPCEDFFEYACGTWNKKNLIPDDHANYNTFGKLRDDLQVMLKCK